MNSPIDSFAMTWSNEVAAARGRDRPLVALESTLITHGLPWPTNLETARSAEKEVRAAGAVPATIAVLEGSVCLGLEESELEQLARHGNRLVKASRRDLGPTLAKQRTAGTTVSSTLFLARRAGLRIAATGGIGGVHRGAGETFDISTDLDELARADGMLLVCSGAKSILDLPATLEAIETRGITVVGYRTSHFPAFTVQSSALSIDWRVESPTEAAGLLVKHHQLGCPGAVLLVQEVTADLAIDRQEMEDAVNQALNAAEKAGLSGKAITPFLLNHVRETTEGRSLIANRALIEANAKLAAQVAVAMHHLSAQDRLA